MNTYLKTLNEREQWMVLSAGFCIVIYIYYFLLYAPLSAKVEERKTQLVEKKQTLQWMNQVKTQKNSVAVKKSVDNAQLLTVLANQLKNSPTLKFSYQLQQTNSGEIQLSFEQIPFNSFMQWLDHINHQYLINIKQLEVYKTTTPGLTRLMMMISSA